MHGYLVGGVEHHWGGGARLAGALGPGGLLARLAGQRQTGEQLRVRLRERELASQQVERRHHGQRPAFGVGERVADGRAHVGYAQVRQQGAVGVAHQ